MLYVVDHPLVQIRLGRLRDIRTGHEEFRRCLHEITRLMAVEITRHWATRPVKVQTPLAETEARIFELPIVLTPILRAGLGMLQGMLEMLPEATVGHIGMYRNEETKLPESYYFKTPPHLAEANVLLLDPMLATGNSSATAATQLKKMGATRITFASIISAPQGIARFEEAHPDIPIYTAAVDETLTANAFITPGLGDAGDRYFGT